MGFSRKFSCADEVKRNAPRKDRVLVPIDTCNHQFAKLVVDFLIKNIVYGTHITFLTVIQSKDTEYSSMLHHEKASKEQKENELLIEKWF